MHQNDLNPAFVEFMAMARTRAEVLNWCHEFAPSGEDDDIYVTASLKLTRVTVSVGDYGLNGKYRPSAASKARNRAVYPKSAREMLLWTEREKALGYNIDPRTGKLRDKWTTILENAEPLSLVHYPGADEHYDIEKGHHRIWLIGMGEVHQIGYPRTYKLWAFVREAAGAGAESDSDQFRIVTGNTHTSSRTLSKFAVGVLQTAQAWRDAAGSNYIAIDERTSAKKEPTFRGVVQAAIFARKMLNDRSFDVPNPAEMEVTRAVMNPPVDPERICKTTSWWVDEVMARVTDKERRVYTPDVLTFAFLLWEENPRVMASKSLCADVVRRLVGQFSANAWAEHAKDPSLFNRMKILFIWGSLNARTNPVVAFGRRYKADEK